MSKWNPSILIKFIFKKPILFKLVLFWIDNIYLPIKSLGFKHMSVFKQVDYNLQTLNPSGLIYFSTKGGHNTIVF